MTWLLRGLFDRVLLVCSAVAGGLVPGFIAQYRQHLGGRLDQARIDLGAWQKIADQFFQGDLQRLVQDHLGNSSAAIRAEGVLVQSLIDTVQRLQSAADALTGSLWHQIGYLAFHIDPDLARATFNIWTPTFSLTAEGLLFAALSAVAVWALFQLIWAAVAAGVEAFAGAVWVRGGRRRRV